MARTLTPSQLQAVSNVERAASMLSLLGCVFTIVTFCLSRSFRKPINRLVFFASFGNMLSNVGTLMSQQYLNHPDSARCQFQAFLIQTFMPADAFWILAMALNVYLTFYHRYDARDLRRMEIPYIIACYGIPFIPAFTYIFIKDKNGNKFYGNATLWCWISTDWDLWRFFTFYVPVWVIIVITFAIYIRAGRTIYEKRKDLMKVSASDNDHFSSSQGETLGTLKTTEVTVTTEPAAAAGAFGMIDKEEPSSLRGQYGPSPSYAVHIAGPTTPPVAAAPTTSTAARPKQTSNTTIGTTPQTSVNTPRRRYQELNNAAWAYTKSALLFFTAILITWIPSCANRVYPVAHDGHISVPLEFMSASVLPLQGFWNAVIYAAISWNAVKQIPQHIAERRRPPAIELESDVENRAGSGLDGPDFWMSRPMERRDQSADAEATELSSMTDVESAVPEPGKRQPSL